MALTPKQENFCLAYVEMEDASAAYRQSYDAQGMGAATVNSEGAQAAQEPQDSHEAGGTTRTSPPSAWNYA